MAGTICLARWQHQPGTALWGQFTGSLPAAGQALGLSPHGGTGADLSLSS